MSQRVELIISCINDTRKALQEVTSSFQGIAAKISVLNYAIRSSYQTVKVSILIQPEGWMLHATQVGATRLCVFQSSSSPKAGCSGLRQI